VKKILIAVLAALLCPAFAQAPGTKTLKGVTLPVTLGRSGKILSLNGMGIRTKVVFKVYVGALYVERPSKAADELISSEQDKAMELVFLRGVDGKAIADAIDEGFKKNSKELLPALRERMDKLRGFIPDLKKGDKILFAYAGGKNLSVEINGRNIGEIEGRDFADALFRCWLGNFPADKDLKKGLLGEIGG